MINDKQTEMTSYIRGHFLHKEMDRRSKKDAISIGII